MGIKEKIHSLRKVLGFFLIRLLISILLAIAIPLWLFLFLTSIGFVNYANRSEIDAVAISKSIAEADDPVPILESVLPRIGYVWYSNQKEVISTSLDNYALKDAENYVQTRMQADDVALRHMIVNRADDFIVLQYKIGTYYTLEEINNILPSPEIMAIIMVVILAVVFIIVQMRRFEKMILGELKPLMSATRSFSAHNLDYDVGVSHIIEINEVLQAFSMMKTELRDSLHQQWKAEEEKRNQIAALSHDIKTPLTVALGNLDLLEEVCTDQEEKRNISLAAENLEKISEYIELLVEMTTSSTQYNYNFTEFSAQQVADRIADRAAGLCKLHDIKLQKKIKNLPAKLYGDALMIERAVINLVQNAIDHAVGAKNVYLHIEYLDGTDEMGLKIEVDDDGKGFSDSALKHGSELLYMDNTARNNERHYGIGLYLAQTVAQKHGGTMVLMNSEKTGGGSVVMSGLCKN